MKVIGNWLTETTSDEGLKFFEMLYEMNPQTVIDDYELERFVIPENIKAIVFPEYQTFVIEDGDEVIVWAGGCCDTIFNTDGIAFMELHDKTTGKMRFQWAIDNSPYEMNDDDLGEVEFDMSSLPEGITREQVIFVVQL